ncbi:EAL domain-containing protein [Sulfidibacter corallicola]|uniref:EAL domain-containing protein n=1 Tax=Sulfidibacter corallicola TaxID=2818388 RepID=A0A8A4TGU7_SULCO|nr:EAL domain-containing protein [Sulfidibacter corallicola]QTD49146.1 EAL domain-containing protein [Sulfidibacter corallicola]
MKSRRDIFLGFAIVLLPPLIAALWTFYSSLLVSDRIDDLSSSLFPILELTNEITIKVNDLKDHYIATALDPDEEGLRVCQSLGAELNEDFGRLQALSDDPEIRDLHVMSEHYGRTGQKLILAMLEGKEHAFMDEGGTMSQVAGTLVSNLRSYREDKERRFSENLNLVNTHARYTNNVTLFATSVALGFGTLLAFWLLRGFSRKNLQLRQANLALESRYREICEANTQLEKEIRERKRAEEALRTSLAFEEALSQVSKLFTSTYAPNLRQVVKILGQVVGTNLSFIGLLKGDHVQMEKLVEWTCGDPVYRFPDVMDLNLEKFPRLLDVLARGEIIQIDNVAHLPSKAQGERAFAEALNIQSVLLMPISSEDKGFWGYMGFADVSAVRYWSKEDIRILRVATEMLSNFLARKRAEKKLKHDAFHDALTGLPNRALAMERLTHAIERQEVHPKKCFAVLFLDLDRFKPINDSLGHQFGDLMLIEVGKRLRTCVRGFDTVARLGGDEFIILLEEIENADRAKSVAAAILRGLNHPFLVSGQELFISGSIGIAISSGDYLAADDALRDADIAMYRAKTLGKSRYVVFEKSMQTHTLTTLKMEADLRRALERDELQIFYQPIISLESGHIIGFESLLRWVHAEQGMILPHEFIALAEETGLISNLGEWALRKACSQLARWQAMGHEELSIAVNFSTQQFYQENLPGIIQDVLVETGVPPGTLKLELTESILMENLDTNVEMLRNLKRLGLEILVDDFGTGYSSLSYLSRFPLTALKIDRSFVTDVPGNMDNAAITSAIIAMANSLDLQVIAEGVENVDQLQFLWGKGCHMVQGFLFSPALSVEEATTALSHQETVEAFARMIGAVEGAPK